MRSGRTVRSDSVAIDVTGKLKLDVIITIYSFVYFVYVLTQYHH